MGACYAIELKLDGDDEMLIKKTHAFVSKYERENRAVFSKERRLGFTLESVLKVLFTNDLMKGGDGVWNAGFAASYGWESVMIDWFYYVEDALRDGSYLKIYPTFTDDIYDEITIVDGIAIQIA